MIKTKYIHLLVKILITIIVIYFVSKSDQLVWANIFSTKALLCTVAVVPIMFLIHIISSYRFAYLLRNKGIKHRFWELVRLGCFAQFAGLLLPGVIGTDTFRFYGLSGDDNKKKVFSSIFLDRIISLGALVILIFLLLGSVKYGIIFTIISFLLLLISLFFYLPFFLSIITHFIKVFTIFFLLHFFQFNDFYQIVALVEVSVGLLVEALPISFSGFGVGHITFSALLSKYNVNGLIIYNIFFLAKIIFKILGGIVGSHSKLLKEGTTNK